MVSPGDIGEFFWQRPASNTDIPFVGSVQPHVIKMQELHINTTKMPSVELMYNFGQQTNYILSEVATPVILHWFM
jgi:hypothetical protein